MWRDPRDEHAIAGAQGADKHLAQSVLANVEYLERLPAFEQTSTSIETLHFVRFPRMMHHENAHKALLDSTRRFPRSRSVVLAFAWLAGCSVVAPSSQNEPNNVHELAHDLVAPNFDLRELWRGGAALDLRTAVVAIGDENGDGVRELALYSGFLDETTQAKGVARVLDGASGALRREHVGIGGEFRAMVVCLGDVDGDGVDELVVAGINRFSAFRDAFWDGPSLIRAGTSLALATRTDLSAQEEPVMVALGDLDGDGVDDLGTIGRVDPVRPELILLSGANLSTMEAPQGAKSLSVDRGRFHAAAAGDVDDDGCGEFIFADPDWQLHLISGKSRRALWSVPMSDTDGWQFFGPISLGPDLDRDGVRDLLATAWFPSMPNLGAQRLEMISVRTGARTTLRPLGGASDEHVSLAVLDDLDHDGVSDLALGIVGVSQSTIELWSLGRGRSLTRCEVPCARPLHVLASSSDSCVLATFGALERSVGVIVYELSARH